MLSGETDWTTEKMGLPWKAIALIDVTSGDSCSCLQDGLRHKKSKASRKGWLIWLTYFSSVEGRVSVLFTPGTLWTLVMRKLASSLSLSVPILAMTLYSPLVDISQ